MDIAVEISLYALQEAYRERVHDFLAGLAREGLRVVTNSMSTQVHGPCDQVLAALGRHMRTTFESCNGSERAVFVLKVLGPLPPA